MTNKLTLAFMLGVCTGDSTHRYYHPSSSCCINKENDL